MKKIKVIFKSIIIILLLTLIIGFLAVKQYQQEQTNLIKFNKTVKSYNNYGKFNSSDNGIAVLCYHRILPNNFITRFAQKRSLNSQLHSFNVTANEFAKQMKFLHDHNIKVISLDEMMQLLHQNKPINQKYVVITFDDADHTMIDNAVPILNKYKFPFTTFIITGKTHQYVDGTYTLSWNDINQLTNNPLCTIGLHTNNAHYQEKDQPILKTMSLNKFKQDYKESVTALYKHLNHPPKNLFFASPYGFITNKKLEYLIDYTKIQAVFSLDNELITNIHPDGEYGRLIITNDNFKHIEKWLTK